MTLVGKRATAAAGTVAVAAVVNVATGMLTQHWALAWWIATIVLVIAGCGLQVWLTFTEKSGSQQSASRIKVTGSVRQKAQTGTSQAVTDAEVGGNLTQDQS